MAEPNPRIDRATADDAEALSRFSALVFPMGCPADTRPEDLADFIRRELTPERYRAMLEDDRIVILKVRVEDGLAGFAMIARGAAHPQGATSAQCELRKFYIAAAYHGRGVATR